MNKEDKIEMLTQPLMTEDGYLNPACMNELESTINNIPKTYNRLAHDSEWSIRKNKWTFKTDIVGAFAMWACRQSPYGVPDGLENVCKYLNAALESCGNGWKNSGMQECSLVDINKWLYEILYEQGVIEFDKWNECKVGNTPDINFVSRYDGKRNPDRDFIDLDALLHNVCLTIRDERRKDKAFDDKFDKEYPNNKVTETFN
jgi:hypothetical protein